MFQPRAVGFGGMGASETFQRLAQSYVGYRFYNEIIGPMPHRVDSQIYRGIRRNRNDRAAEAVRQGLKHREAIIPRLVQVKDHKAAVNTGAVRAGGIKLGWLEAGQGCANPVQLPAQGAIAARQKNSSVT